MRRLLRLFPHPSTKGFRSMSSLRLLRESLTSCRWTIPSTPSLVRLKSSTPNGVKAHLDAEQESELPDLFQESMIEERVAWVMFEIEID